MGFAEEYAQKRSEWDSDFEKHWQEGTLEREISAQFIDIRLKMGMTQEQFADHMGLKQSFVSRLENGEQNMTISTLQQIAKRAGANVNVDISLEESATL